MKKISFVALLMLINFSFKIVSQERVITGKITDYMGKNLGGVNIIAKDYASLTTISGVDGEFRIEVYDFTKVLIFSFANMKTIEVPLGDLDRLLVIMDYKILKYPDPFSIILNFEMGQTDILNKSKASDSQWKSNAKPGFGASLELEYFITKNMGLLVGIGYNQYSNTSYLDNFNNYGVNNLLRVDKDSQNYYLYNEVHSLKEENKVSTISFPVKYRFHYKPGKRLAYYADFGIKIMYVSNATVKANGSSIWQAYYPADHIVLYDIPEYGYENYSINSKYSMIDYKKLQFALIGSIGISYKINRKLIIDLGLNIDRGTTDMEYNKPVYPGDFLNTVGKIDKTILRGAGIIFGIRYHLSKNK